MLSRSIDPAYQLWSDITLPRAREPPDRDKCRQASPDHTCIVHRLGIRWQGERKAVNDKPDYHVSTGN